MITSNMIIDHHPHSHGNVVANVGGDVNAEILLVTWQVQGNVVHVPGVDNQHEEEEDGEVKKYDEKTTFHVLHRQ